MAGWAVEYGTRFSVATSLISGLGWAMKPTSYEKLLTTIIYQNRGLKLTSSSSVGISSLSGPANFVLFYINAVAYPRILDERVGKDRKGVIYSIRS